MNLFIFLFFIFSQKLWAVPLSDNVMFAFEKCKSLSFDLHKGELKEATQVAPFDVHCLRHTNLKDELNCLIYEPSSNKLIRKSSFSGGSHLGEVKLTSSEGAVISFLIGKKFASYQDPKALTVCMGIYLFEKDALKARNSPN